MGATRNHWRPLRHGDFLMLQQAINEWGWNEYDLSKVWEIRCLSQYNRDRDEGSRIVNINKYVQWRKAKNLDFRAGSLLLAAKTGVHEKHSRLWQLGEKPRRENAQKIYLATDGMVWYD